MHVDFNVDRRRNLLRRVNAFFYLNKAWRSEYGGSLVLRRADSGDTVRILPTFNRCAIFNTDSSSHHGHPEPLNGRRASPASRWVCTTTPATRRHLVRTCRI